MKLFPCGARRKSMRWCRSAMVMVVVLSGTAQGDEVATVKFIEKLSNKITLRGGDTTR
jgi:hypothetical protein